MTGFYILESLLSHGLYDLNHRSYDLILRSLWLFFEVPFSNPFKPVNLINWWGVVWGLTSVGMDRSTVFLNRQVPRLHRCLKQIRRQGLLYRKYAGLLQLTR